MRSTNCYTIGIDYGTDSCRALIVDCSTGREIASGVMEYPRWAQGLYCDLTSNRYRQHPLDYIEALEGAVACALKNAAPGTAENVVGLCFDTTGSTPVLTDRNGIPLALTPAFAGDPDAMFILWKDHTSVIEAEEINALATSWSENYIRYEGGIYSSEWVWSKVLHILRTNSAVAKAAWAWSEHCDWITGLITGNTSPETMKRSRCAAGHKAMWHASWGLPSETFLERLDPLLAAMRPHLFSKTDTSDTKAGTLTVEWAKRLGLTAGISVAVGAIDAHMGAVGAGIAPHVLTRIMGTSTCDIMVIDPVLLGDHCVSGICGQVDGSVLPGYIGIEAGQSAFGDIYAWFRDVLAWPLRNLCSPEIVDTAIGQILPRLTAEAEKISPGKSGIVALDWFNGRRTPFANQTLRGALTGLTLGSSAPMIFRALVEATAFGSRAIIEHMKQEGIGIDAINAIGGISQKSPFVMQTLADVLDMPIRVVRSEQACALGAAMFAAVAAGIYSNIPEAQAAMGSGYTAEYKPDPARTKIYDKLYRQYLALAKFTDPEHN
ncbi:ribulokinase [uncultured Alistipes sp.]|uniref:ribulokinase n=1 Tax=uncultured Alistipes sp. TaxID=538949 RepID=UPI003209C0EE